MLRRIFDYIINSNCPIVNQERPCPTLLPIRPVRESGEVDIEKVKLESTVAYTVFGRPISSLYHDFDNFGPPSEDKTIWEKYLIMLTELFRSGKIKPNNARETGTIDDIPTGFETQ